MSQPVYVLAREEKSKQRRTDKSSNNRCDGERERERVSCEVPACEFCLIQYVLTTNKI